MSEQTASIFSVDYYRSKAAEFQRVLSSLDQTGSALYSVEFAVTCDAAASQEWYSLMQEFQTKRDQFRLAAEGINLASNGLNAIGVNFPSVTLPAGLGIVPLVPMVGVAAAFAVAATLISWSFGFFETVESALRRWQYLNALDDLPPEQKVQAIEEFFAAEMVVKAAKENANSGSLGQIAIIVKWVVVGALAYGGYRLLRSQQNGIA